MRIHHATAAKAKKFHITLTVEDNEVVATSKAGVRLASGLQGNKVLEDAITKATGNPAKGNKPITKTEAIKVIGAKLAAMPTAEQLAEGWCKEAGWKKTRWGFRNDGESSEAETWEDLAVEQELMGEGDEPEAEEADDDSDADQSKSIVKAKYKERYKPTKDKCGDDLSFQINEFVTVEDDETGDKKVSKKLLKAFAEANGCWRASYGSLVSRTGGWNAGQARMHVGNRLRGKIRQTAKAGEVYEIVWPK